MGVLAKPDYYFSSVTKIDIPFLRKENIACLLLDVDCTIADYRRGELDHVVAEWLRQLQEAGIQTCLVSNGGGVASNGWPVIWECHSSHAH